MTENKFLYKNNKNVRYEIICSNSSLKKYLEYGFGDIRLVFEDVNNRGKERFFSILEEYKKDNIIKDYRLEGFNIIIEEKDMKKQNKFNILVKNILLESPLENKRDYRFSVDFIENNLEYYERYLNYKNKELLLTFIYNNKELIFFKLIEKEQDKNGYICLNIKDKIFCSLFDLQQIIINSKQYTEISTVWNHLDYKGLSTYLFNNYIIDNYSKIICDGERSKVGKQWFNKILLQCLQQKNKFKCYILNLETFEEIIINSVEDTERFYKQIDFDEDYEIGDLKFQNYRIAIEKV